ncbi:Long-chain-fatty-acid--CoA ligase [bacterium HR39]|nr:Long-chain-fatty-acid--CoA ligase [bacterium HR39]
MDIARWIERHAAFTPERPAIRFGERVITWRELDARVRRLARGLDSRFGLGRGDRVAWLGLNHPDMLLLLFACARLGLVLVPLNARLAPAEHAYILDHAGVEVLFCGPGFEEAGARLAGELEDLRVVAAEGPEGIDALLAEEGAERHPHVDLSCPILLVYTSGTTGRPKGAVLTQAALFWNAVNSTHMHDLGSADRVLTVLPMFHVGGLNIQTTPALHAGAEVVLLERFDADAALAAIEAFRPTLTVLVPATMRALIEHPRWERADLSCLRMIACGSQVVPLPLLEAFNGRGVPAAQVYGSTETCPIAVYQRAADALRKPGSTGKPGLHVEMRIVDREGRDVPPGERGEVWIRGPNVMSEYWRDEKATREALVEGWFRTGDVGVVDGEGDLWIVDRIKDVVISGGENIYPAELEAVLHAEPRIREAVVVGRPDPRWGEVPVAVVVRADPALREEEVLALFEGRLARFKHPRAVVFVEELPRNVMGKVLKYRLREWLAGAGDDVRP